MDALFYDGGGKASKKGRRYRRKDRASMVSPGGPRQSSRLRSSRQRKLPSFVDLEADSAA